MGIESEGDLFDEEQQKLGRLAEARIAYKAARRDFFELSKNFIDQEKLQTRLYRDNDFFYLSATAMLVSIADYQNKIFDYFFKKDHVLERILGEEKSSLAAAYPENFDDLSITELQEKTKELSEKQQQGLQCYAEMQERLRDLCEERLQEIIQKKAERFKESFGIDFAKVNRNQKEFQEFQRIVGLHTRLTSPQKDALYLIYLGLSPEEASSLKKDCDITVEYINSYVRINFNKYEQAIRQIGTFPAVDSLEYPKALAGMWILDQASYFEQKNRGELSQERCAELYAQYQKYTAGVESIDQEWKAYLAAKGVDPSRTIQEIPDSNENTEQDKIAAVQRVREPLNNPEWIANPLQKIKAFAQEALKDNNNETILSKHRNDGLLANVGRAILSILEKIGLVSTKPKSKQVANHTERMAAEIVAQPEITAPRMNGR